MSQQEDQAFVTAFKGVIIFLVGLAIAILILAIIISKQESGSERSASYKEALIAPIGKVNTEPGKMVAGGTPAVVPAVQPAAQQARSGKEVVESVCSACHGTGVLNAPKIGDKAAWQPRIAQGENVLLQHAIQGFKGMPAKGGATSLSEEDMAKAVNYMLEQVGAAPAKAEAQAPAAPTPAAQAPAAQAPTTQAPAAAPSAPAEAAASQATSADKGKQVYTATCFVCHGTGAAGAPKLDDKAAWQPRAAQGMGMLVQHATQGFKAMPPKGGNQSLTEDDIKTAIAYMLEQAGVKAQ